MTTVNGEKIEGLLIAGSEPHSLRQLGEATNHTETYGVDVMWEGAEGTQWGMQRKTVSDFLSSLRDGRIGKELLQMESLDYAWLTIEGSPAWSAQGDLIRNFGPPITHPQWCLIQASIQMQTKVGVLQTTGLRGTILLIEAMVAWSRKPKHKSLFQRGNPPPMWGSVNNLTFQAWMLQGVPGVGAVRAEQIVAALGGSPYTMRVSKEDLLAVPGVGPKLADAIVAAVSPATTKESSCE